MQVNSLIKNLKRKGADRYCLYSHIYVMLFYVSFPCSCSSRKFYLDSWRLYSVNNSFKINPAFLEAHSTASFILNHIFSYAVCWFFLVLVLPKEEEYSPKVRASSYSSYVPLKAASTVLSTEWMLNKHHFFFKYIL